MSNATNLQHRGNPTAEAIVARLPNKPILNAREIADALALAESRAVVAAIEDGALLAVKAGKQYRVARAEAARWLRSLEAAK